ncbi:MAG TPA: crotonase/enoyl-CoA hydratase family protein [Pseudonocardiaceae bacterium]|nr:crotonase/enoyl-CoA hydratase family protein [Pseudonocardiaceae bacterium]
MNERPLLHVEIDGSIAVLRLTRPEKRNALNELLIREIGAFFAEPPSAVRAAVLFADGEHFCAGLDLDEHSRRTPFEAMEHSRLWHRAFETIEHGRVPLVAALHGAVIGGGLELALTAHVRVADSSTFYAFPEGRLGIFVGGGASVRAGRILGADRMREMMLTGRRLTAEEGHRLGLTHELVAPGSAQQRARDLAVQIAGNAPLTNQLILTALARIGDMARSDGFWAEALVTAVSQSTADAEEGLRAFLAKRPPEFRGA